MSLGPAVSVAEGAQPKEADKNVAPGAQGAHSALPYEYVLPTQA